MIILDPIRHRENTHYMFGGTDDYLWIRTSIAADYLQIEHETLNRDCKRAYEEGRGNLRNLIDYIYRDERGEWWVRQDIDDVYTMVAPGKAGRGEQPSWFYVRDLNTGPRP